MYIGSLWFETYIIIHIIYYLLTELYNIYPNSWYFMVISRMNIYDKYEYTRCPFHHGNKTLRMRIDVSLTIRWMPVFSTVSYYVTHHTLQIVRSPAIVTRNVYEILQYKKCSIVFCWHTVQTSVNHILLGWNISVILFFCCIETWGES